MRILRIFIIVMACAAVIGIATNASARGGMNKGVGGWYHQDQSRHYQDDYGSTGYDQMNRNSDGRFDPTIDRRNLNSNADNGFRSGGSMMGYAPSGGGYCR